ncbi:hypothetical protein [Desulfomonile tiedjei]|uniref:PepSY domain-containing protein n=1 Tax=Desulfomonile tiedjei (strain ATCC 49306 / DSM 6799 / DCB-1) TaxID=706587 RepID=I4C5X8_DESTA|nr:hypothetical protein [Desulfomonile tiedjei]AFM24969.1 hypothetical protein Desti_2279 [Desulfomonile tiedjei DSM 6799]
MKEVSLRLWHRQLGIILAIFIIIQAGTGFVLNLGQLAAPHTHEQDVHEQPSRMSNVAITIHHGGGIIGTLYRLLLGAGLVIQAFLGILIFIKIRSRSRGLSVRNQ